MLAERSDIQEELVRMKNHIQHFLSLLDGGGEVGKKLDFLLQEMNREANTLHVEDHGRCRRRVAHHRAGPGHEVGDRKGPRTGAEPRMSGIIFIISAPSGSGKSTLTNELRRIVPNLEFSISYTTRPPRGSEQSGREYFFITREEFERMIRERRIPGVGRGFRKLLRDGQTLSPRSRGARTTTCSSTSTCRAQAR